MDLQVGDQEEDGKAHLLSLNRSNGTMEFQIIDRFPQNSQHMRTMCLQHLAASLDIPPNVPTTELRQMVESKLSGMKQNGQKSMQLMLQQSFAGAILHMIDAYGAILDTEDEDIEMEEEEEDGTDFSNYYSTPSFEMVDSYRLQIQDLEIERDRLEESLLLLREDFERERERSEIIQQLNCEQELQIELLKKRICDLEEAQKRTEITSPSREEVTETEEAKKTEETPLVLRKSPRIKPDVTKPLETTPTQPSTSSVSPLPSEKLKSENIVRDEVPEDLKMAKTRLRNYSSSGVQKPPPDRPFQCEYCSRTFREKQHLTMHVRQHAVDKTFRCKICKKRLSRGDALRRHMRIHTGDKPFDCEFCGKAFRQEAHLSKHLANIHC